MIEDAQSS